MPDSSSSVPQSQATRLAALYGRFGDTIRNSACQLALGRRVGLASGVAYGVPDPGKAVTTTVDVSLQSAIAVSISPSAFTVQIGAAQALAATVTGTDDSVVSWSLQETGGGTVNAAGSTSRRR